MTALANLPAMLQRVGIRELRRNSRYYLARVVAGEHFEVTVFGRPVADLGPASVGLSSVVATADEELLDSPSEAPVTMRISAVRSAEERIRVIRVSGD